MLLVGQSEDGCWIWLGPRHSSGAGRYMWRARDGGNDRYVASHRVSYYLSTGDLPSYMRNLCGNPLCCKASHYWTKPSTRWKPKPRKAIRGRVRQLSDSEIRQIRLLASLSHDEDEIGKQYALTRRQVADIAMGHLRPEAGGRIRTSRHLGIRFYHAQHEEELRSLSMRTEPVVPHSPVDPGPQLHTVPAGRPFPHTLLRSSPEAPHSMVTRSPFATEPRKDDQQRVCDGIVDQVPANAPVLMSDDLTAPVSSPVLAAATSGRLSMLAAKAHP